MTIPDPDAPLTDADLTVLAGVRDLWEAVDPVPAGLVDQIQFAIDLNTVDLEVSRLIESRELAAARTDEHTRVITFQSDSLSIMIAVEPHPDRTVRVDGWLSPGASHRVELRSRSRTMSAESDDDGRFSLDPVPAGIAQLIVHLAGNSRRIVTPSMEF